MDRSASRRGIVVQQYPTESLDGPDNIRSVARRIGAMAETSKGLVVVVQPRDTTNESLIGLARATSRAPDSREMDMLLATGEQICIALLAMDLIEQGYEAVSFTGDEAGIVTTLCHTKARILRVCPKRVRAALEEGKVVIVAGSQGVSPSFGEITTLEPAGPRNTARALAAALQAETAEICEVSPELSGNCSQVCGERRRALAQRSRRKYQRMPDFSNAPATITAAKATNPVICLPVFYTAP